MALAHHSRRPATGWSWPQRRRTGAPTARFTAARLAALEAAGKPVFVNLTADWCVTCLINERVALDSAGVRQAFAARGIVALKGDWTNRNPEITTLLQQYGRSGVPLYLLYGDKGDPVILPQIMNSFVEQLVRHGRPTRFWISRREVGQKP